MNKIKKLIEPKSIAVIGASSNPKKVGHQLFKNIIEGGFKGEVYPVNSKKENILGFTSVDSISSISKPVDLAIIVIPVQFILDVVKECIAAKVSSIIIISSGFSESGHDGKILQDQVKELCESAGVALLGPNCLGLINTEINLNASFSAATPNKGNVGFISQSGAMVSALIDWSKKNNIGLSKVFSMGNMAQIHESDILEFLYSDQSTEVILMYLETLVVDQRLTELLIKNSKKKPTLVLYGGKTKSGNSAAVSHTGAIVSSFKAVETYLKQSNLILADGLDDFFFTTKLLASKQTTTGNRVAIITNAGGPSIISCDELEKRHIPLSTFTNSTVVDFVNSFSSSSAGRNPVDILGDATSDQYKSALEIVAKDKNTDIILVLVTRQSSTDPLAIANEISEFECDKIIIPVFIGDGFNEENALLSKNNVPCYDYPEQAISAINHLVSFNAAKYNLLNAEPSQEIYNEDDKFNILKSFKLPVLEYYTCTNASQLDVAAIKIGFPMVVKTADPNIIHKSDAKGVALNIQNLFQLEKTFKDMGQNVIVGKMLHGHEIFIGAKKDKNIGTIITFGTGGIYSEIYHDFSYGVAPINIEIAKGMIDKTKIGKILDGARGQKRYNKDKLAEILVNTALFVESFQNIAEVDFNPLIATDDGYFIVDARIILNKES